MGVGDWFKVGVVGESFQNPDGQSRQKLIYVLCKPGCDISLRREPENTHDSDAVAVWASKRILFGFVREEGQIGYVPSGHIAQEIASWIDRGGTVEARFLSRHGQYGEGRSLGVVIEVRRMGEPTIARRPTKKKQP